MGTERGTATLKALLQIAPLTDAVRDGARVQSLADEVVKLCDCEHEAAVAGALFLVFGDLLLNRVPATDRMQLAFEFVCGVSELVTVGKEDTSEYA